DVHRGVELDPGIAAASPDHTAGDRLAGLQLDRYTLARHELAVDMGHHPASGDVADQTELAAAIDDDCADAQDLDVALVGAPLFRLRNVVRKGEACLHDAIL